MKKQIKTGIMVEQTKTELVCDVCRKPNCDIKLTQNYYGWGNDSIDGCGESHFCSVDCLVKFKDNETHNECCFNALNDTSRLEETSFEIEFEDGKQLLELLNRIRGR